MEKEESLILADSLGAFPRNLYHTLVKLNPDINLICSPISIQTCAGMLRMGADDGSETAKQLDEGLNFTSSDVNLLADGFYNTLNYYQQSSVLQMANKIYIMQKYQTRMEFSDVLTQKFLSNIENIDFSNSKKAANTINAWVESQTNSLIKDVVQQNVLNADTRLVLVNAIRFKGEWTIKFDESTTQNEDFFLDDKNRTIVDMMHSTNNYFYADLTNFEAKALRMAYKDSELYMLIILPNQKNGLNSLEQKLRLTPLDSITSLLKETKVSLKVPKFKAEFETELTPVFKELGISIIFSSQAEFGKMLEQNEPLSVSNILHKAFIEVNEEGTEAAAATAMVMMVRSAPAPESMPEIFHANHPFYYTIYDENHGSLFVGNLLNPAVTTCGQCCEMH
ncbi:antichymotrypsin-2-like [Drosophila montana]|uniref:antichymotrypsin-2-like n=1 Tax=Drosophila montana TaxID=40370 RepID=UPI00313ED00A